MTEAVSTSDEADREVPSPQNRRGEDSPVWLSRRAAWPALLTAVSLFLVGLLVAWTMGIDSDGWWQLPLFAGGGVGAVVAWRLIPWPDTLTRYLSFPAVVLLGWALNRSLYVVDFFVNGERFSNWPFFSTAPEQAVFKAEVATGIGLLMVTTVFVLSGGARRPLGRLLSQASPDTRTVLRVLYIGSLAGATVWNAAPQFAFSLGQLLPTLHATGIAAAFCLPLLMAGSLLHRISIAAVLTAPFLVFALGSGMKSEIIIALFPLTFLLWFSVRGIWPRLLLVMSGAVAVVTITAFVGFYRVQVWYGQRDASAREVLSEFAAATATVDRTQLAVAGARHFILRSNASVLGGWAISHADEHRREPELTFAPMAYVFVPRVFWPEKPEIQQGREFTRLLHGPGFADASSTASGLFPGFYLGGGWPAVLVGAILIGFLMAVLIVAAWRFGGALLATLFSVSMVYYGLRLEEQWTVGAISEPVVALLYLIVILTVARVAGALLRVLQSWHRPYEEVLGGS